MRPLENQGVGLLAPLCISRAVLLAVLLSSLALLSLSVEARAASNPCLDQYTFGQQVIKELGLYEEIRDSFGVQSARDDWRQASVAWSKMVDAGVAGPLIEQQSCDSTTNATYFYAASWYNLDSFGNGSELRSLDNLNRVKKDVGFAKLEIDKSDTQFANPTINELEQKLRAFFAVEHYDYDAGSNP